MARSRLSTRWASSPTRAPGAVLLGGGAGDGLSGHGDAADLPAEARPIRTTTAIVPMGKSRGPGPWWRAPRELRVEAIIRFLPRVATQGFGAAALTGKATARTAASPG